MHLWLWPSRRKSMKSVQRLNGGELKSVKKAFLANAQSKVLLVEFHEEIAKAVLREAQKLGAAPNPVGAESKYEVVPMFYRVSGYIFSGRSYFGKQNDPDQSDACRSGHSTAYFAGSDREGCKHVSK